MEELGLAIFYACYGILCLSIACLVFSLVKKTALKNKTEESYSYRKHLTNMIVAGKLKQIASKEKIDIPVETKEFYKYLEHFKKDTKRAKDLDDKIEDKIQIELDKLDSTKSK